MSAPTAEASNRPSPQWPANPVLTSLRSPEFGLIVGIAVVLGLIFLLDPSRGFFDPSNLRTLIHNVALYGVMALGAAVVIVSGGIDLSVGAVAALASIVSAKLMTRWLPLAVSKLAPRFPPRRSAGISRCTSSSRPWS